MLTAKYLIIMPALVILVPQAPAQDAVPRPLDCEGTYMEFANQSSAPRRLWDVFNQSGIRDEYEPDVCRLNPWYLMGDFNADGRYDFVVMMRSRTEPDVSRLAVLWDSGAIEWLDIDDQLKYPGPDAWSIYPSYKEVHLGAAGGEPPVLIGDGIVTHKLEASSSLVYWNGTRFVYYWQGD